MRLVSGEVEGDNDEYDQKLRTRLGLFLAVMGPGVVTAFADNDAGGIATYAAAGAKYGYGSIIYSAY